MNTVDQVAAALRDLADMVEATGITNLRIGVSTVLGEARVGVTPSQWGGGVCERADLDTLASYVGAPLAAGHSTSTLWSVRTAYDNRAVTLPCGVRVSVNGRVNGRPLDLAPLPQRRRKVAAP